MPQYQCATEGCEGEITGDGTALCDRCLERLTNRTLGPRPASQQCADCGAPLPCNGICRCNPVCHITAPE